MTCCRNRKISSKSEKRNRWVKKKARTPWPRIFRSMLQQELKWMLADGEWKSLLLLTLRWYCSVTAKARTVSISLCTFVLLAFSRLISQASARAWPLIHEKARKGAFSAHLSLPLVCVHCSKHCCTSVWLRTTLSTWKINKNVLLGWCSQASVQQNIYMPA